MVPGAGSVLHVRLSIHSQTAALHSSPALVPWFLEAGPAQPLCVGMLHSQGTPGLKWDFQIRMKVPAVELGSRLL